MPARRAVVVGGGIIGTAVARQLSRAVPDWQVTLLEKEASLATHQTGRNSGVVHAGLYYAPGSLKAQLCRRGVGLLREYVAEHDPAELAYDEIGKVVVALDAAEQVRLAAIRDRAVANGVPGIRLIGPGELAELEPHAAGIAALHSPHTAIVDYLALTAAFARDVVDAGGEILLDAEVRGFRHLAGSTVVESTRGDHEAELVIVCGGLQSDRLAVLDGQDRYPRIVPFLGDYLELTGDSAGLCRGLVYPVPDPRYPFLGVHVTRHVDGSVSIGPNAFLSPGREAYRGGIAGIRDGAQLRDLRDAVGFAGFWRFAAGNVRAAARESRAALSTRSFVRQAQRHVPAISLDDVRPGTRGIRAQAMNRDGSLLDDFAITVARGVVHVRNAPSPGATSSMAIAEHVVATALDLT